MGGGEKGGFSPGKKGRSLSKKGGGDIFLWKRKGVSTHTILVLGGGRGLSKKKGGGDVVTPSFQGGKKKQ